MTVKMKKQKKTAPATASKKGKGKPGFTKATRVERARKAGRACLATYGREFYQEMARKRHEQRTTESKKPE